MYKITIKKTFKYSSGVGEKVKNKKLVKKHNRIIEYKGSMTVNELKLFSLIVAEVGEDLCTMAEDSILEKCVIDVSPMKENTKDKNFYSYIKDVVDRLEERKIEIEKLDKNGRKVWTKIRLISRPTVTEDSKNIELFLDKEILPYMLDLKREYTRYEIENILKMGSSYSIRIYELLKQYENMAVDYREFCIEDLRGYLGIEDTEYARFDNFENRVLKVAVDEINKYSDIRATYTKIKKGRRVAQIRFDVQYGNREYLKYLNQTYDIPELRKRMGLSRERFNAKQIIDLYSIAVDKTQDLVDVYGYVKLNYDAMINKGTVRNKYGYLTKALKEDYAKAFAQLKHNYIV